MAKRANQKRKLLFLREILLEQTDEEHALTIQQLINALEAAGMEAERKSVYDDLKTLQMCGMDVQNRKGRSPGWFVGERHFELPELKLLVDAVQSCKFITRRKSDLLIKKLEGLTSAPQAWQLQRQVYVDRRAKTMNGSVYYSIDKLHAALGQGVGVTFHYFEYNVKKEQVFRRNGRRYAVIPYGLIWDNENYYLVGWDLYRREVRHYRVDKMVDMNICKLPEACPEERGRFDVAAYTAKHFNMFSGREGNLRLRCKNTLAGVILDRFGQDSILVPDGDAFFTVMVDAVVSAQFWGWLFGLGADITVTGPDWAVNDYRRQLAEVAAAYSRQNGGWKTACMPQNILP